ncbi:BnaA04g18390D [Brassica napus]|uniref:BnaA04g18390D protein n=1 Tax=Brassica napus TaxID=3708 RepID=A0A078G0W5_BRANA|nr:BnaA04g18390D [Brassica napus]
MATNDEDKKRSEGEKRCFDLFATLLHAFGDDETRAKRGQDVQARNMLMIDTIISAATNTFLLGKRKIDDESKNQQNTASSSSSSSRSLLAVVESKRRRVVESNDEPIRAQPIREIKPPVKERKRPFVRDNDLEVNQTRRLWSFHSRDGTLFLAFDPLTPAQPQSQDEEGMALALVPFNPEASSSSLGSFVCEEANRRLLPKIPRSSRSPRVCVSPPTSDSSDLYLEGGLDLNRTPSPECTEMDPDLEAVQETHIRWTSQEAITETSLVSFTETTTVDLELRL